MPQRCASRWDRRRAARGQALSLVEVLVVLALLMFLLALLVPGLGAARERVRRVTCANNLRQWGVAGLCYRDDHDGYLPTEGTYLGGGIRQVGTWYNELPPYLGLPPYKDFERDEEAIRELPHIHVWICPSKNLTEAFRSGSGMNQVLDGLGSEQRPSPDAPDFPDQGSDPIRAHRFARHPNTVFLFDIAPNSPAGTPRNVATRFQRTYRGGSIGEFHGDYANVLYLDGRVGNCKTDDLVTDRDFRHGGIVWTNPDFYWGYPPR